MSQARLIVAAALLLAATGCTRHARPVIHDLSRSPGASWARVLEERVDEHGRVDFDGLARNRADLDTMVLSIAIDGAERDEDEETAWLINAYNALALHNVLESGKPPSDLVGFFVQQQYEVSGRWLNLYDLERRVILPRGEARVHFALNCMSSSCPRLRRTPFEAALLESQLDAAAREFANDVRHVRVDETDETVHVSKILEWYESDFTADGTIIDYLNQYRDTPIPSGYRVRYMDYDWTLIAQ
ncbi:MAG: DUF547 domain-containing protein [Planctomycetota bacterium]